MNKEILETKINVMNQKEIIKNVKIILEEMKNKEITIKIVNERKKNEGFEFILFLLKQDVLETEWNRILLSYVLLIHEYRFE